MTNVRVEPITYEVTLLPKDYREGYLWTITVEYRGRDLWAVKRNGECLGKDGTWDWESNPSSREDDPDWLPAHRFGLQEALELANEWAPKVEIYSHRDKKPMSAQDVIDAYPDEVYGKEKDADPR